MSARLFCDGCGEPIDREVEHFGVNHHNPPDAIVESEGEPGEYVALALISPVSTDEDFHACSSRCLGLWAMRTVDES